MMALAGIAYSCMVVSSFSRAQVRVLQLGFADDINTYVMISGMINYSSINLHVAVVAVLVDQSFHQHVGIPNWLER